MTGTPTLGLTLMSANVAQKETIFNEAIITFDILFRGVIIENGLTSPPGGTPAEGDTYVIGASATGLWSGHDHAITFYFNGWQFVTPPSQIQLYDLHTSTFIRYTALNTWTTEAASTVSVINDLADVTGTPTSGQVLTWNASASQWEPATPSFSGTLEQLTDVNVTTGSGADGKTIIWDNATSRWILHTLATVTTPTFLGLSDVSHTSAATGWLLAYTSSGPGAHFIDPTTITFVPSLADIGDVSYGSGPLVNDVLAWNGSTWGPSSATITFSFANMIDGPGTFVGAANEFLVVNALETALEYVDLTTLLSGVTIELQHLTDVPMSIGAAGQALVVNSGATGFVYATVAGNIEIDNNGTSVDTAATKINFVNAVSVNTSAHDVTVTLPVPNALLIVQDHGTPTTNPVTTMDFAGAGVTTSETGGVLTVTISGVTTLAALTDVTISSPADGDLLQYSVAAGKFINADVSAAFGLIDGTVEPATYELGPFAPPTGAMFGVHFQASSININTITNRGLMVQPASYGGSGSGYATAISHVLANNTAPWIMSARVAPNSYESAGFGAGIAMMRSDNFVSLTICNDGVGSNPYSVKLSEWTSAGTAETNLVTLDAEYHWFKLSFDGTFIRAYVSNDGIAWMELGTTINATSILGGDPTNCALFTRLANVTSGNAGGLFTYYDDPDFPASSRTAQGVVSMDLSNLPDVDISGLANGDGLFWDSSSSTWKAQAPSGGTSGFAFVGVNTQTASYTGVIGDAGKLIDMNDASANTFTVPLNASVAYAVDTIIFVRQRGVGVSTIAATGGVTLNAPSGTLAIGSQYGMAMLTKVATDTWAVDMVGSLGGGSSTLASDTDVTLTSPANAQSLTYNNSASKWENTDTPFMVGMFVGGIPANNELVAQAVVPFAVGLPSGAGLNQATAGTAATASAVWTILKNGSSIGTFTFAMSGTVATFTIGSSVTFAAGDLLGIVAPTTADATLADISITLALIRI